jgi:hypothetical protein
MLRVKITAWQRRDQVTVHARPLPQFNEWREKEITQVKKRNRPETVPENLILSSSVAGA